MESGRRVSNLDCYELVGDAVVVPKSSWNSLTLIRKENAASQAALALLQKYRYSVSSLTERSSCP